MQRYLAVSEIPAGMDPDAVRSALARVAKAAHDLGARPIETLFSVEEGHAYSLFGSDSEERVREAHERADLPDPRVFEVERVFTELLDVSRRERFS